MRSQLKTLALALAVAGLLPASQAIAQACDYPLIIQQGQVAPNVMFLVDSSGSMNEPIFHDDYEPWTIYAGNFTTTTYYYVGATGTYEPSDFKWYFPSSPSAPLIQGDCCGASGWYTGNYLNWIYFHANDTQRAELPQETRLAVGKAAVSAVYTQATGINYGLMKFNTTNGGKILQDVGTAVPTLLNSLANIEGESGTPSGEALLTALNYFKDSGSGAPIQYECQQNFLIFVTDGAPTFDKNVPSWIGDQDGDGNEPGSCATVWPLYPASWDCSDYMDDVAYYMANEDLRGDLDGDQNVFTYTIGFALDHDLIKDTAANGQGLYLVAWDLESLLVSLGTVIGDIVSRVSSGAAVAVVSTESGDEDALYRGKFWPGLWRGFLEAYHLPYEEGDQPFWEAGQLLQQRTAASRTILYNWFGDVFEFNESKAPFFAGVLGWSEEDAENLINYVRGEHITGKRDRDGWKLGDLVYSTPVVVGPPSRFFFDEAYQQFLRDHQSRRRQVYVGSNDGMLHAFDAATGYETWAYVPWGVTWDLPNLWDPNYCHDSYVDLSPIVEDLKINGQWKTVLFGGERTGGNTYFAIDVTNPEYPNPLWEAQVPYVTSSFTEPSIAQTKWVPVVWTGSAPNTNGEAWLTALNAETGSFLGAAQMSAIAGTNMAAAPVAYDSDFDGKHDRIYQADLAGNLWRWDISSANPGEWTGYIIYEGTLPIQTRPAVAVDENQVVNVYFGTGKYVEASDLSSTSQMKFYAVRDFGDEVPTRVYENDLVNQTSSIENIDDDDAGWYFSLENGAGERVIEPAVVVDGVVYFTSFAPASGTCSGGGQSWLYSVSYLNGAGVDNEDHRDADSTDNRSDSLGEGVASRPVVNLLDGSVVVQTSDARLNVRDLETTPQTMMVRSWREELEGEGTYEETTEGQQ